MQSEKIEKVKILDIIPNKYQPRKYFDEKNIMNLANSIKEYGVLNPILVTKVGEKYEIIAGERRYRAAKILGLEEIPAIIKNIKEEELSELALIENLHREDLNSIEEAKSYQDIIKLTNITQEELAKKIGKSQSFIANKIRLLSLPDTIKNALINKKISERHARSLMTVTDKNKQEELLERIIKEKITVKELDRIILKENTNTDEIQSAIDDIIKSLKIEEEKKEEKESDKMNNGNFFPNYNNQVGGDNTSLNMMNSQTIPTPPTPMVQETVMPSAPLQPEPTPTVAPTMNAPVIEEPVPVMDPPLFNPTTPLTSTPIIEEPIKQMTPPMPSAPLQPEPTPTVAPTMNAPVIEEPAPMIDPPLFNPTSSPVTPDLTMQNPIPEFVPSLNVPESTPSSVEVPIETQTMTTPSNDNITKVKEFLDQNGIQYKSYSNETNQCIIIEI